ncbi:heavy metal translocating P-type ATPase [Candidatus Uabimicrobium amorphum]|uniref:P-type Zn(2+) transporter n=1 Tax=Uabimicrobium amorphum TaxID=2596890 RepID=A0A5S9F1R5_UABAM|nr:cation-translocating P-type ATPase [Candidatus Uabimicrobium amorphum]BBM82471.1 copper-translocating P-type ATPase [Candidatus Uabimicrobium amorphum]
MAVAQHQHQQQQQRVMLRLFATFLGGALIINSFFLEMMFKTSAEIAALSAFFGAIVLGAPVIIQSIRSITTGQMKVTELASIAILSSVALEMYQTAGIVAFFMLVADALQTRTALGARDAIESLIRLAPNEATLISSGSEQRVVVSALKKGDIVRVRPGENIPADGIVVKGQSVVEQAKITGESLPVDKMIDSEVFAGTTNATGMLEIKVTKVGEDTTLGRVKQLILEAEKTKTPIMQIIDKHVSWYTPTIIMLAALILYFSQEIERAITALVVTCPSALVLATPTALVAAISCAARLGILIKDVKYLEEAAQLNSIVFDKTGTLTTGNLAVTRLSPAPEIEASNLLSLAASLEQYSNHPVAKAVVTMAKKANIELIDLPEVHETAGKGMSGYIEQKHILIGRESWLREEGCDFSKLLPEDMENAEYSVLYIAQNKECVGWIGLEDTTREEAFSTTKDLKSLGCKEITMLTGDRWPVARKVGKELGCTNVHAECLPETKQQLVEKIKQQGSRVAVVGDGVNDAPALAAGNIGIAMAAAQNDIAINSASIALLNDRLDRLPFLIKLARKTKLIINENLFFGIFFIIVGLTLSGFGLLTPIWGAILHNIGALVIVFNSARLVRFGEELM